MNNFINRIKNNSFAKDSIWSILGNGLGNALSLLAGIIIARFLGKDLYGEYGMVKTTMFYIAAFSTFGLGYTSTKFIADSLATNSKDTKGIIDASMMITWTVSCFMCIFLFVFSSQLANYINTPQLSLAFKYLGIILISKAVSTTQTGILAGYKAFKELGINNIIFGIFLFLSSIVLTYYYSITGALLSLLISQIILCILNERVIRKQHLIYQKKSIKRYTKKLLTFSFPVALQELSYTICNWGSMLLITKFATIGEVGIYSAATQWGAIILFIPSLLQNVILSYLSNPNTKDLEHNKMIWRMIFINFTCTFIPFLFVYIFSGWIITFYGPSFVGLKAVMNVYAFSTVFMALGNVFQANLLAKGVNWPLFYLRVSRDIIILCSLYCLFTFLKTNQTALYLAYINVVTYAVFVILLIIFSYKVTNQQQ